MYTTLTATPNAINQMRRAFEKPWNTYHIIHTLASVLSFGLLIWSLFVSKNLANINK